MSQAHLAEQECVCIYRCQEFVPEALMEEDFAAAFERLVKACRQCHARAQSIAAAIRWANVLQRS